MFACCIRGRLFSVVGMHRPLHGAFAQQEPVQGNAVYLGNVYA